MHSTLRSCLADLHDRIDQRQEEYSRTAWIDFLEGRCQTDIFTPPPRTSAAPTVPWPSPTVNAAMSDPDSMLLQQLRMCSDLLAAGGRNRLAVRCNYGTGIIPSLFGCELFFMNEKLDTLPTAVPLGTAKIKDLIDRGVPNIRSGLGATVFETAQRFLDVFREYHAIGRHVALYHPDVQGPIDAAEVIWGSDIFLAVYDQPDLLRQFLALITETYIAFMREWYRLVPRTSEYSVHWGLMHKGALMLRNDSLMNLSPDFYVEFVRPLDQRLFDEFGGGAVHFCGRGDHYIQPMSQMRGLHAVNLSQPRLNNMQTIFRNTVDKGIKIIGLDADAAITAGRPLRGHVHCSD